MINDQDNFTTNLATLKRVFEEGRDAYKEKTSTLVYKNETAYDYLFKKGWVYQNALEGAAKDFVKSRVPLEEMVEAFEMGRGFYDAGKTRPVLEHDFTVYDNLVHLGWEHERLAQIEQNLAAKFLGDPANIAVLVDKVEEGKKVRKARCDLADVLSCTTPLDYLFNLGWTAEDREEDISFLQDEVDKWTSEHIMEIVKQGRAHFDAGGKSPDVRKDNTAETQLLYLGWWEKDREKYATHLNDLLKEARTELKERADLKIINTINEGRAMFTSGKPKPPTFGDNLLSVGWLWEEAVAIRRELEKEIEALKKSKHDALTADGARAIYENGAWWARGNNKLAVTTEDATTIADFVYAAGFEAITKAKGMTREEAMRLIDQGRNSKRFNKTNPHPAKSVSSYIHEMGYALQRSLDDIVSLQTRNNDLQEQVGETYQGALKAIKHGMTYSETPDTSEGDPEACLRWIGYNLARVAELSTCATEIEEALGD